GRGGDRDQTDGGRRKPVRERGGGTCAGQNRKLPIPARAPAKPDGRSGQRELDVTVVAKNDVIARVAENGVIAKTAEDQIVAGAAGDGVVSADIRTDDLNADRGARLVEG